MSVPVEQTEERAEGGSPAFEVGDHVVTLAEWFYIYGGRRFYRPAGMRGTVSHVAEDHVTVHLGRYGWVPFAPSELAHVAEGGA